MATATYEVLCDWENNGFSGGIDDITSIVKSAEWAFGKDNASQFVGKSVAGNLTVVAKNDDGRFNSFNAASPLSANLLPGKPMKVVMTVSGTSGVMWQGFLDSIEPTSDRGGNHEAMLRGLGSLARIRDQQVSVSIQSNVRTSSAMTEILDQVGWPSGDRQIKRGSYVMPLWFTGGKRNALNTCRDVENTEPGLLREHKNSDLGFEGRHHRVEASASRNIQATFDEGQGASNLRFQAISQIDPNKHIYNIVKIRVKKYTAGSQRTLWTHPESGADSPTIPASGTRIFWAEFPNPDIPTSEIAAGSWVTPVANTDYSGNSSQDGSGTDLTTSISVGVSKFDTAMKITLSSVTASTIFLPLLQARGTPVVVANPVPITAENAASQSAFGEREYPVPPEFIGTSKDAQLHADEVLRQTKDPIPRLMIGYEATKDTDHLVEARDRDISHRITIDATGNSDIGTKGDYFVESQIHRVGQGGTKHFVEYECSPASVLTQGWLLGVAGFSELGETTTVIF